MRIYKYVKIAIALSFVSVSLCLRGADYTNALVNEPSPYLQQHAHNPVAWYPWGKEALQKAKKEGKLLFLSIGYSTCHWCHVMEEESFTDRSVAALLNRDFVSIKIDREQYPNIDKKYQRIYRAVHGERGGWPLSVFLTPRGEVLDIRTYIPKEEGYGSEGLLKLLPKLAALRRHPDAMKKRVERLRRQMQTHAKKRGKTPEKTLKKRYLSEIGASYDRRNGGFGMRPKFPEASKLETLMTLYRLDCDESLWKMVEKTLDAMANGGIYDQIEGGFFRYTLDATWQTPHFEKMLYTNAEAIRVYAQAYLLSGKARYRRIATESIEAMRRYFGYRQLFFSAADADSDGEEGGYYLENYAEIRAALPKQGWDAKTVDADLAYYGIEEDGNIDGERSLPHIATKHKPPRAEAFRRYLRSLRKKRAFPFVDKKINTAWNAMMIDALFAAASIDRRYAVSAVASLEALWRRMYRNGILYHQTVPGIASTQEGLLEDYAFVTKALIDAYEYTFEERYLKRAVRLASEAVKRFYKNGRWYLDKEKLSEADFDDRYYTSALSVILHALLTLSEISDRTEWYAIVRQSAKTPPSLSEASAFVALRLRLRYGDIVVHASKVRLLEARTRLYRIRYPFVLSRVEESNEYLACTRTSCMAHATTIDALIVQIDAIERAIPEGGYRWRK